LEQCACGGPVEADRLHAVARFDANGVVQWSHGFGNGLIQGGARVAAAPGGFSALVAFFDGALDFGAGELTASRGHDIVVANFRPDGTLEWQKQLAVFRDACTSMPCEFDDLVTEFDADGNLLVGGPFRGSIDIEGVSLATEDDAPGIFLAKFDRAGHLLWSGRFGDATDVCRERGHCELSLAVSAGHDPLLGGSFRTALDFGAVDQRAAGPRQPPLLATDARAAFLAKFLR
jgi:hypothetical protein